jgi:hypothetical protein
MKKVCCLLPMIFLWLTRFASADTVILRDGSSYSGRCAVETVTFTGQQGVKYEFPVKDVQSMAFNTGKDTVVLRNGKSYTGQFTGLNPIGFQDAQGIKYQFPTRYWRSYRRRRRSRHAGVHPGQGSSGTGGERPKISIAEDTDPGARVITVLSSQFPVLSKSWAPRTENWEPRTENRTGAASRRFQFPANRARSEYLRTEYPSR